MKELTKTHHVHIQWRSFELRPAGSPPIAPEYMARIEASRPRLRAIAREQCGVELNEGPFGQNSRSALIGAKYAEANGFGEAYHQAILEAYWLKATAIEPIDQLVAIAESVGIDPATFRAALEDPTYIAEVEADIELAQAFGLSGVPAIVFERKYLLSGAQPVATLRQVCDRLAQGA